MLCGIILRVNQHFIIGRPLWEDEAHLALNFVDGGYIEMFMPLKNFQSAPILFLLGVETFSKIFGFSEIALRSFPFIISICTYPLFYFFVRDLTRNRRIAIIAFILFTFNTYIIQYSSELKPYTVELSAYIFLGFIVFSTHWYIARHREKLLTAGGIVCLFIANTSFITLFCIVLLRWMQTRSIRKSSTEQYPIQRKKDNMLYKSWGIAFVCNIILNIIINPYADNMLVEWKSTFIPINVLSANGLQFLQYKLSDALFDSVFTFCPIPHAGWIIFALSIAGTWFMLFYRLYHWIFIAVAPLCIHLFLSWAQLYPLHQRFLLYLSPATIIVLSAGVFSIMHCLELLRLKYLIPVIPPLFLVFALSRSTAQYPLMDKNIKPCLDVVNSIDSETKLYTTKSKTLYEYYFRTGYTKNATRSEVNWVVTPQHFIDSVNALGNPYILLYSAVNYDGYVDIVKKMDSMGIATCRLENTEYGVVKVTPHDTADN